VLGDHVINLLVHVAQTEANTAGTAAIVTAIGGVAVSLSTVYLNSRKQSVSHHELENEVSKLREEVSQLRQQLHDAEQARLERDQLNELILVYGGRRLKKRLSFRHGG
jgi:phosphoenolpyruvate-protein kinase (PTS system EI component)